jgi:adenine-specific DNA-methyltransferase
MHPLPRHLPKAVADLVSWADASEASPLAADRVPGAVGPELTRLAALGALARKLAPSAIDGWPEPLAAWAREADVEVTDSVATTVRESLNINGYDILALAYEHIVSGVNRRRLGTFFTPEPIVKYMIDQSNKLFAGGPKNVVDPGAGVGAFTLAALDEWPAAIVTAVDVNVVTLGLLAARAAAQETDIPSGHRRLVLTPSDYLEWIQSEWPQMDGPRLILGNPPYTRSQHMTTKEKQAAKNAAGGLITSGLAGLSAYFLAATLTALGPDDAACFLLPASWCETRYGREMREWIWRTRTRQIEAHFFPSDFDVFPGTQVTAMVLLVGSRKELEQPLIARAVALRNDDENPSVYTRKSVELTRDGSCPLTFTEILAPPVVRKMNLTAQLGDIARIRRGVATGASSFFFLSDTSVEAHGLPDQVLRRALVKPAHCLGASFNMKAHRELGEAGLPRWLLDLNDTDLAETDEFVVKYLDYGRQLGIDNKYLTRHRPGHWYMVEPVKVPDLFLVPVGKPNHRIITNEAEAVGSNNLYGIYIQDGSPWTVESLAHWLRSDEGQTALTELARHYHGGSLKIEPGLLRTLRIPPIP